jgi:hypothetical protein
MDELLVVLGQRPNDPVEDVIQRAWEFFYKPMRAPACDQCFKPSNPQFNHPRYPQLDFCSIECQDKFLDECGSLMGDKNG